MTRPEYKHNHRRPQIPHDPPSKEELSRKQGGPETSFTAISRSEKKSLDSTII